MATRTKRSGSPSAGGAGALRRIPAEVLREIDAVLADRPRITKTFVETVDARFSICGRFGLVHDELGELLRERRRVVLSRASGAEAEEGSGAGGVTLREYRARQLSVAAILDSVFGKLAKCDPSLWERRAYLLLVGMVYERLAASPDEVETDELVKLAKALASARRAIAKGPAKGPVAEGQAEASLVDEDAGELPPRLARAVRMVYGMAGESAEATDAMNGAAESRRVDCAESDPEKSGEAGG